MTDTPKSEPWGRIADRGQLNMAVYTRAGAADSGISLMPCAAFLGILCTDFETQIPIHYLDTESLLSFVEYMAPREVNLYAAREESITDLAARIQRIIDVQKGRAVEFAEVAIARAARR